jgi:hypothetical protein
MSWNCPDRVRPLGMPLPEESVADYAEIVILTIRTVPSQDAEQNTVLLTLDQWTE